MVEKLRCDLSGMVNMRPSASPFPKGFLMGLECVCVGREGQAMEVEWLAIFFLTWALNSTQRIAVKEIRWQ
jgi:hypothetical protein